MSVSNEITTIHGRSQFQAIFDAVFEYEAMWNPASVNSNSFLSETITVPGVKFGDMILLSYAGDLQDLSLEAHIHSADTVDLHLTNNTAGAVDLAAAQLHVIVVRPYHRHT